MQVHTAPSWAGDQAAQMPEDRLVLLEEVDFKWLMAGHGWWIDTGRLHNDPSYVEHLLDLVDVTKSAALQDCAAVLRARVGARH